MDYKEKYEMALEGIQEILGSEEDSIKMSRLQLRLQGIFPELKESEDERIRKSLIVLLQHFCKGYRVPGLDFPVSYKDMLAWLEKQGEQKPAWSEEDETIANALTKAANDSVLYGYIGKSKLLDWLKSLKDRFTWKPSDEQMNTLEYYMNTLVCNKHKEILFGLYEDLKKLKKK